MAYPNLPGYHMWSTWDRLTVVSTFGPAGSEEEDIPDSSWDFSALNDPGAMRGFMSACDHCLFGCSDDGHDLDDEGYVPSRECFHVDLGDHNEGNHLGMPEVDDPPGPSSRIDIPRELAVVPVPAGGQDIQLEQIREMQAQVDGEAGRLVQLRQNIEQEWAGRSLAGEACHRAQDIRHRIIDNARAALPPAVSGSGQDLAAAAMLLRAMPKPSTTEGRRIQGELKNLLEGAAVRRAESSASRRRADPSEHHAVSSRRIREASVRPERTRDEAPTARERLGNEHHHLDHRARLDEKVHRGYHPRRGDAVTARRTAVLHPNHLAHESSAGPYDEHRSLPVSEPRLLSPSTRGRRGRSCGSWTTDWPTSWEGRMMTTSSSVIYPFSSPTPPEPGWSICLLRRSPTGMIWSKLSRGTSKARMCALGTRGTSEVAASSQGSPSESTSGGFRSSAPSCPTLPTRMSSGLSLPAPLAGTW
jgi:hypothetical protein